MLRRPPLLLLLPLLSIAALASPAPADDTPAAEDFIGYYRHAGGEAEARSLEELVEQTAEAFNPLLRAIARSRLERTVVVPESIEIVADAEQRLSVRAVGARDLPDDPRLEDGAIVVRQSNFEGSRRTAFRLTADGTRLIMRVTTSSALLPEDLDYQLTFERIGTGLSRTALAESERPSGEIAPVPPMPVSAASPPPVSLAPDAGS